MPHYVGHKGQIVNVPDPRAVKGDPKSPAVRAEIERRQTCRDAFFGRVVHDHRGQPLHHELHKLTPKEVAAHQAEERAEGERLATLEERFALQRANIQVVGGGGEDVAELKRIVAAQQKQIDAMLKAAKSTD